MNDLTTYQLDAARTANNDLEYNIQLAVASLGLAGEAGEAAEFIKKHLGHGHALDIPAIKKELGDVLWYAARLATLLQLDLYDVANDNLTKLRIRYPDKFTSERSLLRCSCGHHFTDHDGQGDPCFQCGCDTYDGPTP